MRGVTGTTHNYEGDWMALFTAAGTGGVTFNERMLAWINNKLSASYDNVNSAMQAYAASKGVADWDSLGTFIP